MCGRIVQIKPAAVFSRLFGCTDTLLELTPRYNLCPTQALLLARNSDTGEREMVTLYWGLVPVWAKDLKTGYSTINARVETVATKPAFRHAFKSRRCLIAADSFYEWQKVGTRKQPYYIHRKDEAPYAFAGLWERWIQPDGNPFDSCSVIVWPVNDAILPIHVRQPVIVAPVHYDLWMDPALHDPNQLLTLLRPYPVSMASSGSV